MSRAGASWAWTFTKYQMQIKFSNFQMRDPQACELVNCPCPNNFDNPTRSQHRSLTFHPAVTK